MRDIIKIEIPLSLEAHQFLQVKAEQYGCPVQQLIEASLAVFNQREIETLALCSPQLDTSALQQELRDMFNLSKCRKRNQELSTKPDPNRIAH